MEPVRTPSLERRVRETAKTALLIGGVLAAGYVLSSEPVRNGLSSVRSAVVDAAYNRPDLSWPHARELYRR